jgi:hypothetical protein
MPTVRDVLNACKGMPDDAIFRPQWVPGCEPRDYEPGVKLVGFDVEDGEVLARVKLYYLCDIEDDEGEEEETAGI